MTESVHQPVDFRNGLKEGCSGKVEMSYSGKVEMSY